MIPILYEIDEQNFVHNGLGMLPNVVDSYAYEVANAEYEMYLEYPTTEWIDGYENKIWRELKIYERQILYKPSHSRDPHAFRIYDYEVDSVSQVIKVWAKSRAYDLAGNMLKKVEINSLTPQAAMTLMAANLMEPTDFTFYSNMTTTTSSTTWEQRSGLSCIMGQAGSLIQYWGGEVLRENKRISVYDRVGRDNVTSLRIGKNIEQLVYQLDTNDLVTAIVPYHMQRNETTGEETLIYGDIVKSAKFANYRLPYYQFVEYREEDGVTDLATLNTKAATWFNDHKGQDEPNLTIDVDMADVAESSEYAAILKRLEQVNTFDTVTVYVGELDIDLEIKVAALKYDGVNERNLGVTLGKPSSSLFETYITPQFTDLKNQLDAVRQIGIIAMTSADGKNTNYHGAVDPNVAGLVGVDNDLYFQQDGTAQRMWRWGAGQWNVVEYKADWLTGTIDAQNLNVVNINMSSLVGQNATLVQGSFNAINATVQITGEGMVSIHNNGRYFKYGNGALKFGYGAEEYQLRSALDSTTTRSGLIFESTTNINAPIDFDLYGKGTNTINLGRDDVQEGFETRIQQVHNGRFEIQAKTNTEFWFSPGGTTKTADLVTMHHHGDNTMSVGYARRDVADDNHAILNGRVYFGLNDRAITLANGESILNRVPVKVENVYLQKDPGAGGQLYNLANIIKRIIQQTAIDEDYVWAPL